MKFLFAGPTLSRDLTRIRWQIPGIVHAGPAGWGDVARAVLQGATAIGLIDGRFEDTRAVWHKEILFALSSGVAVAGAGSMGALRAAECAAFGMVGIGKVYREYGTGKLVDDADVAQIHAPSELGYLSLSEPLVNVDPTLRKMALAGLVGCDELDHLLREAYRCHYKDRTYRNILKATGIFSDSRLDNLQSWLSEHAVDQKRQDALALVGWLQTRDETRGDPPSWTFSETSQWRKFLSDLSVPEVEHAEISDVRSAAGDAMMEAVGLSKYVDSGRSL